MSKNFLNLLFFITIFTVSCFVMTLDQVKAMDDKEFEEATRKFYQKHGTPTSTERATAQAEVDLYNRERKRQMEETLKNMKKDEQNKKLQNLFNG